MPDDSEGILDQPEWQAFERSAPLPSDGGEWLWSVAYKVRIETILPYGPDGAYTREVRVYRQTSRGNWLRFLRIEEVVRAAYRGESVAQAARSAMSAAQDEQAPRRGRKP